MAGELSSNIFDEVIAEILTDDSNIDNTEEDEEEISQCYN